MGITTTFFICYNLAISSFNKLSFLIFSLSLSHTLKSPDIAMPDHCLFLYFINYRNIWSSGFYHVIILYGEIWKSLKFLFSATLSESCSYQKFALLNPSFSQNCHYTYLSTLSCLCLYSFSASLPHSLTISDIV